MESCTDSKMAGGFMDDVDEEELHNSESSASTPPAAFSLRTERFSSHCSNPGQSGRWPGVGALKYGSSTSALEAECLLEQRWFESKNYINIPGKH